MKRLRGQLFVLLVLLSPLGLLAQQTVTGTVLASDTKEPLTGASVRVEGTIIGSLTDEKGVFSLKVENENAVLLVSYFGYSNQKVELAGRDNVEIGLEPADNTLNDVVVVGYTTRKKGEVTGSVSTINSEVIERTTNKDLAKSLAGRVPGLIINDRGGYPGSTNDVTLLIRGRSTLGNNAPLILIDGIPAESFSHLSPQDIASLSVLKDGAAAIYGARAANGVILITTKRGNSFKPQISLTSTYNLSTFSSTPRFMSSE
ncbi:MAG: TonB-dependent receptor plug domain-containing protein, partial [Bacteroidota bacterium]